MTPENQAAARERAPGRIWVFARADGGRSWHTEQLEAEDVEYVRADLLQQPASEQCGECGHSGTLRRDGVCVTVLGHGNPPRVCGHRRVYPATGATRDLGIDTNFPLSETLKLAVEWLRHLNDAHDCDCHGWEQRSFLIDAAERYQREIAATGAGEGGQRDDLSRRWRKRSNQVQRLTRCSAVARNAGSIAYRANRHRPAIT